MQLQCIIFRLCLTCINDSCAFYSQHMSAQLAYVYQISLQIHRKLRIIQSDAIAFLASFCLKLISLNLLIEHLHYTS